MKQTPTMLALLRASHSICLCERACVCDSEDVYVCLNVCVCVYIYTDTVSTLSPLGLIHQKLERMLRLEAVW